MLKLASALSAKAYTTTAMPVQHRFPACPARCVSGQFRPFIPTRPYCPQPPAGAARDFVQSCLNRDEKQRPTAEQLLEHPWLQEDLEVSDVRVE